MVGGPPPARAPGWEGLIDPHAVRCLAGDSQRGGWPGHRARALL